MELVRLVPSFLFSYGLRVAGEGWGAVGVAENALQAAVVLCCSSSTAAPSWPGCFLAALVFFLALAYFETEAEYLDRTKDARETTAYPVVTSEALLPGSCPAGFGTSSSSSSSKPATNPHLRREELTGPPLFPRSSPSPRATTTTATEAEQDRRRRAALLAEEGRDLHGKALLFQCRLRHKRTAPFRDNFSHSYLYVGVPVGLHACYAPLLCVDEEQRESSRGAGAAAWWPFGRAVFNVRPQDHAVRGGAHLTLRQKLTEFLVKEGEDPSEWAYAYLVTNPSVAGQMNKPLIMWYLYSAARELTAVVIEVDSSFVERRMWLTRNVLDTTNTTTNNNSPYCFRGRFVKDLQISPFLPTALDYTIDTCDPCAAGVSDDNNRFEFLISARTPGEGGRTLMVARASSTAESLDPSAASLAQRLSFAARWWWVPMASTVTARILSQAARIYLLRAPRTWSRPEPKPTAISKPARTVEKTLERYFFRLLEDAVARQSGVARVRYITSGEHAERVRILRGQGHGQGQSHQSQAVIGAAAVPAPVAAAAAPPSARAATATTDSNKHWRAGAKGRPQQPTVVFEHGGNPTPPASPVEDPHENDSDYSAPETPTADLTHPPPMTGGDHDQGKQEEVTFEVLSPIFYSRFFSYRDARAALASELLDPEERTHTACSSDPELFASLFENHQQQQQQDEEDYNNKEDSTTTTDSWSWALTSLLRRAPPALNYARRGEPYAPFRGPSRVDRWVARACGPARAREYRRALLRVRVGELLGGCDAWPFYGDFELLGFSRDAAVRGWEAGLKAALVLGAASAITVAGAAGGNGRGEAGAGLSLLAEVAVTGLNVWAGVKTLF